MADGSDKTIKRAFLLILGSDRLSGDQIATIIAETDSVFNSRPQTHASNEIDDDLTLTSHHFQMGHFFVYDLAEAFYEAVSNRLSSMSCKPAKDRLDSLKWMQPVEALERDDLVWALEDLTPRGICQLGRLIEIFTDSDDIACSCKPKTALGNLEQQQ